MLVGQPAQPVNIQGARASGDLHNALIERHLAVEGRGRVQDPVMAHHRRLDHRPGVQFNHKRDHAGIREKGSPDGTAGFGNDIAKFQLDHLQMWCVSKRARGRISAIGT